MGARAGLEPAGDGAPHRAAQGAAEQDQRQVEHGGERTAGEARQGVAEPGRQHGAHGKLALGADVEQAGAEGEGDAEAGEDERRGPDERLAEGARRAERALPQAEVGEQRVQAGEGDHRGAGEQRRDDGQQRHDEGAQERAGRRPGNDARRGGRFGAHDFAVGTPVLIVPSARPRSISSSRAFTLSGTSPSRAWNGASPTGPVNRPPLKLPSLAARIIWLVLGVSSFIALERRHLRASGTVYHWSESTPMASAPR